MQKIIEDDALLENVNRMGGMLNDALQERFADHAYIGDIRGRGLFRGLELVADRSTKEPLPHKLKIESVIKRHGMARGLVCYPGGGTIDGLHGNHILLAPPFIINEGHISELVEKLGETVDGALREVGVLD